MEVARLTAKQILIERIRYGIGTRKAMIFGAVTTICVTL